MFGVVINKFVHRANQKRDLLNSLFHFTIPQPSLRTSGLNFARSQVYMYQRTGLWAVLDNATNASRRMVWISCDLRKTWDSGAIR